MATKDDGNDKEKALSPLGLENLADIMVALADRYRQAAKMMREAHIDEIRIEGVPTAIRGIGYLDRNTRKAVAAVVTNEKMLDEVAPEISKDLIEVLGAAISESVGRQLSTKRKKSS
jgi:hypothetical protein